MKILLAVFIIILLNYNFSFGSVDFGFAGFGSFGFNANSDYNYMAESMGSESQSGSQFMGPGPGPQPFQSQGGDKSQYNKNLAGKFDLEARLKVEDDLMFAFGLGIMSLPLDNPSYQGNQGMGPNAVNMNLSGSATSFSFTEYYIVPISKSLDISLGLGVEYCLASMQYNLNSSVNGMPSLVTAGDFSGSGLGVNLKLFFDYKISKKFTIITGLVGRFLSISGFKGNVTESNILTKSSKTSEKTLFSGSFREDSSSRPIAYGGNLWYPYSSVSDAKSQGFSGDESSNEEATVNLSGINLYFGLGFYF